MVRTVLFMAFLAACGGGGPTSGDPDNNNPGTNPDNPAVNVATGDVHLQINPTMTGVPAVRYELRNSVTGEVLDTGELMPDPNGLVIEDMPVDADEVAFSCPDFCIAVPGGNTNSNLCTGEWNVHPLTVTENDVTTVAGTLFAVLRGPWQTPDGVREVSSQPLADGTGGDTNGFSPINFRTVGYTATPTAGPCQGTPLAIEESGTRITVDCGVGTPYTLTQAN